MRSSFKGSGPVVTNAFIGAADKLARALDTDLGRVKDRNGRETIRAAAAEQE